LPCDSMTCQLYKYQEMSRPERIERPARDFPDVKFVVSHLANPYFTNLRRIMKRCPNVSTDISGQFVSGSLENTKKYRQRVVSEIEKFLRLPDGLDRVMFATDFPIQSYEDTLDLVARLHLSEQELKCILGMNAKRLLDKEYVPKRMQSKR